MDEKPRRRIRDPELLRELHQRWRECVLCGKTWPLSLHHVSKHPRDDVEENLVMVCGSGTTGCHGLIEARDEDTLTLLGAYIIKVRPNTVVYLYERLGPTAAQEWFKRHLLVKVES